MINPEPNRSFVTVNSLMNYAIKKSKLVTDKPITFRVEKLPEKTAARTFTYYSSVNPRKITRYGISINTKIYELYKSRPYVIRQLILHEISHLKSSKTISHGKHFREVARSLGVKKLLKG